ncbi:MAG: mannosyltransferase family protein [Solirubrobacteraceae bacterium]
MSSGTRSPHSDAATAGVDALKPDRVPLDVPRTGTRRGARRERVALRERFAVALRRHRWTILVYLGSRVLLFAVALVEGALGHHSIAHELANWDGLWYRALANKGYPAHVAHAQTTLGFFPLYPIVIWLVAHAFAWATTKGIVWSITVAGVIVSTVGGLVATLLVQRLAASWWGEDTGRRAAVLFCLFPGSVVFSMVYAEGLLIPLAAGCILALQRRRWILAGLLAGLATAAGPEALVLILVCVTAALLELRRSGWLRRSGGLRQSGGLRRGGAPDRGAWRSLLAPLLSVGGVSAFAVFLWAWTGTPFANLLTQHYGWGEKTDPFALVHLASSLAGEISFKPFNDPTINLNLPVGLGGAVLLIGLLVLVFKARHVISVEAIAWTLGISFLAITSEFTPPNPRLLITAFPAVIVAARYVRGRAFPWLLGVNGALLVVMSAATFVGTTLRP